MTHSYQMEAGNDIPQRIMHGFTQLLLNGELAQWVEPYNQTYISIVSHQNGKITHYKDYWNPMVVLESDLGGNENDQQ
ncbi:nuclear transport factor 2-like protein [Paenibacillus xylanivorans]|uniref:Uncharacterized protein n=1 Tax=Paenibacillus xylanivorans TaxID=1705561 RepID=A0A0M9BMQ6_9BACL|nr:hypothetical protein [Paenibacillus xylanivorans]KOY15119.1 hypothetical protein AMS66_17930 [Paenibacillus xylanivorans]